MDFDSETKSLIEPGHFGDSSDNIIILENFVELQDLKIHIIAIKNKNRSNYKFDASR